jgi:hypothetical protein
METSDYTVAFSVSQTPEEAFAAWWSGEIEGDTNKLGAEFTYRYKDVHRSRQEITEFVPGKRIVWHVSDSDLSFAKDKSEWTGTNMTRSFS